MIGIEELKAVYLDKLQKTGSFDQAFTKAIWTSFLKGIETGQAIYVEPEHRKAWEMSNVTHE